MTLADSVSRQVTSERIRGQTFLPLCQAQSIFVEKMHTWKFSVQGVHKNLHVSLAAVYTLSRKIIYPHYPEYI
jgi:hypothetical protein